MEGRPLAKSFTTDTISSLSSPVRVLEQCCIKYKIIIVYLRKCDTHFRKVKKAVKMVFFDGVTHMPRPTFLAGEKKWISLTQPVGLYRHPLAS